MSPVLVKIDKVFIANNPHTWNVSRTAGRVFRIGRDHKWGN